MAANEKRNEKRQAAKTLAEITASLALGSSALLYVRFRFAKWYVSVPTFGLKLLAAAFAPLLALLGLISALLGTLFRARLVVVGGGIGAILLARYVRRVMAPHDSFERTFGLEWPSQIPPNRTSRMRQRRWTWRPILGLPRARLEEDVVFWTIPGTNRQLLCDIWKPPSGVAPSKLALIYLHGGAWQSFDKDYFTRPLFCYLAAQGHTVIDVAYRLCPETDMYGMVGDVKRAIAWVKANASRYDVHPERVVVAGGSAGGQLALLAAYTPNHPALDPPDMRGADTSVRAVVSYYGLPDLRRRGLEAGEPSNKLLVKVGRKLGFLAGDEYLEPSELARKLFGGSPQEVPDVAALMSPITHVGPFCPPTLLLQGSHDHITPLDDVRKLYGALWAAGVQVVYVELPQVEHAFDLFAPQVSLPAQAVLYDLERFLALML